MDVPQDRQSTFQTETVPKRKKDIPGIEISEGMMSDITAKWSPNYPNVMNRWHVFICCFVGIKVMIRF